jgi:hypothetical protein
MAYTKSELKRAACQYIIYKIYSKIFTDYHNVTYVSANSFSGNQHLDKSIARAHPLHARYIRFVVGCDCCLTILNGYIPEKHHLCDVVNAY